MRLTSIRPETVEQFKSLSAENDILSAEGKNGIYAIGGALHIKETSAPIEAKVKWDGDVQTILNDLRFPIPDTKRDIAKPFKKAKIPVQKDHANTLSVSASDINTAIDEKRLRIFQGVFGPYVPKPERIPGLGNSPDHDVYQRLVRIINISSHGRDHQRDADRNDYLADMWPLECAEILKSEISQTGNHVLELLLTVERSPNLHLMIDEIRLLIKGLNNVDLQPEEITTAFGEIAANLREDHSLITSEGTAKIVRSRRKFSFILTDIE